VGIHKESKKKDRSPQQALRAGGVSSSLRNGGLKPEKDFKKESITTKMVGKKRSFLEEYS
jgi:hypothetical protein